MPVVSLAQMLESGVHFGHQTRRWNPKMSPYIFTERNGVHIIDLVQTAQLMEDAYEYMRVASEKGKKFLFVGTKRQAAGIVAQEAQRCGAYYVNQRWLGGMLTNWTTIKSPRGAPQGFGASRGNRRPRFAAEKRSFGTAPRNGKTPEISGRD